MFIDSGNKRSVPHHVHGIYGGDIMSSGMNQRALLQHIMELKQLTKDGTTPQPDTTPDQGKDEVVQMTETRIYIGLNDSQTKKQLFETKKYMSILKKVCRSYHVAFSVNVEEGGYYHENGEYTEETSLVLVLIDADRNVVREIAKDLCSFFRQESVLVTENQLGGYFISQEEIYG